MLLSSLAQLELYARGNELVAGQTPFRLLEKSLSGLKNMRVANAMSKSHLIVGTFGEIKAIGTVANLEGKTIITSAVHDDQLAFYKQCKVNLVIDVSPNLFGRVVGVATLEAMILAHLGRNANELADDEFEEIITELDITPRLLHPTGKFRNIRRFAFVVHPLSQEFIKKGFPIPKATPKMVMDKVEQLAAYIPPQVYCHMQNIVSPTGAEAEGWLLFVGGTPKEMLSHSPEFTYRRLLAAAAMAEKMGAQLMGLGAFTKVVGDAGVTVARRATIPITTGNSYSASGALWAAADAMKRMGLVPLPRQGQAHPRQDHGHRRVGLDRLGQRAAAGDGLRRGGDRRARHEEARGAEEVDPAGHARRQGGVLDRLRQPAGRHGHDRHQHLGCGQEDPGHHQGQARLRHHRRGAPAGPAARRGGQAARTCWSSNRARSSCRRRSRA